MHISSAGRRKTVRECEIKSDKECTAAFCCVGIAAAEMLWH